MYIYTIISTTLHIIWNIEANSKETIEMFNKVAAL